MKKILFFYLFFGFALLNSSFAQDYYDVTYDIGYYDHPNAFIADSAGNIIVCGWSNDADTTFTHAFAIKVNADGQEVWRITLPDTSKFYAVCVTSTGNIALAGSKNDHCFLTMVEPQNGNEVWSYIEDTLSGYWLGTVNEYYDSSEYRLMTFKTTKGINFITYYIFNSLTGDYRGKYQDTVNGQIAPVFTTSNNVGLNEVWAGATIPLYNSGLIVERNFNNGATYTGAYWTFSALHVAGVEKYSDTQGCVVRLFDWGPNEFYLGILTMEFSNLNVYGNAFQIVHDNFEITGSGIIDGKKILVTGTIDDKLALWFVDHDLTYMEENIIPTANPREGIDVLGLPSNDMVIMGIESYNNTDATNLFLMKLDYDGTVSTKENKTEETFTLYPNPGTSALKIKTALTGKNIQLHISDVSGREILVQTVYNGKTVNVSRLKAGIYFYRLTSKNGTVIKTGKWVKL